MEGLSLFKDVYNANEMSGTTTELTQKTEAQLADHIGASFFQRQDIELSIPLPALKLGRYTFLTNLFGAQEKTSRVHVITSQSVHTTLLESQSYGMDFLFKLSPYQSSFFSLYQRHQKHRDNNFSSNYISGRKKLFTFEDATDKETSFNLDIGQRWHLPWINLEWKLQQLMLTNSIQTSAVSEHRPASKPLLDIKVFRHYQSTIGHWHPSIQLIQRQYVDLIDGIKAQLDFIPHSFNNTQLSIRQGKIDTQMAITQWWQRPSHSHSLQYQIRHFSARLESSKVETLHQLQWAINY
jgi:hypothetical protein